MDSPSLKRQPSRPIARPSGSFYGTANGGNTVCGGPNDCGLIFQLFPDGKGGGTVTTLYSFNGTDGSTPNSLVLKNGVLYGSTVDGGSTNHGIVYKLVP